MNPKSDDWHRLNRAVRAACKERGIDNDARKALVLQVTGKASLGDCAPDEVRAVLGRVKGAGRGRGQASAGKRHRANNLSDHPAVASRQKKILALWLVIYDLAIMDDNSDAALNAFVRRHSGVDALQWLNVRQADRMIDRIKAMIRDKAAVDWAMYEGEHPGRAVVEAQFRRLVRAGALPESMFVTCRCQAAKVTGITDFKFYKPAHYHALQKDWGRWLRRLKEKGVA